MISIDFLRDWRLAFNAPVTFIPIRQQSTRSPIRRALRWSALGPLISPWPRIISASGWIHWVRLVSRVFLYETEWNFAQTLIGFLWKTREKIGKYNLLKFCKKIFFLSYHFLKLQFSNFHFTEWFFTIFLIYQFLLSIFPYFFSYFFIFFIIFSWIFYHFL